MTDRRLWSYKEIAAHIRVQPDTVRPYRKHGLLPPPHHVEGGKPFWYADTVRAWVASRPGNRAKRGLTAGSPGDLGCLRPSRGRPSVRTTAGAGNAEAGGVGL